MPASVSLQWGETGSAAAETSGRLLRLPEGEVLRVSDPTPQAQPAESAAATNGASGQQPGEPGPLTYQLSLPPFTLQRSLPDGSAAPGLSQAELDLEPETAPVD